MTALATAQPAERTLVLGVLNVTPDSFSDGQPGMTCDDAVRRGLRQWDEGADVVDVGGESTRPGSERVPLRTELRRVVPVVEELVSAGVRVSIDTTRRRVAEAAVAAGASLVNDVSAGRADPSLPRFVAECGVPYVMMHSRGPSIDMGDRARYADVVADVVRELRESVDAAVAAGVRPDRIVVDPGLGFAKRACHNWRILGDLDALSALGRPVLVGASRKTFLGGEPVGPAGLRRPVSQRDGLTAALTAILAAGQVWGVRVHDVRRSVEAVQVAAMIHGARPARTASRSFRELPVGDLAGLVAARTPMPAGGTVAALATELAAGLAAMAGRFGDGAAEPAHAGSTAAEAVSRAEALRRAAEPLADEDAAGYTAFLAALAEPAEDDPQGRKQRVRQARSRTVDAPLAMAEIAAQCAVLAADLAASGNRTVRGDAATAVLLCHAATRSASIMVAENLGNGTCDERAQRVRSAARTAAEASDRVLALFPGAAG